MLQNKCFFQMAHLCCGICSNVLTWWDSSTWCSLWRRQKPLLTCTPLPWKKKWCLGYFTQNCAELAGNQYTGHMYCSFCTGREKKLFSQSLWVSFSPPHFAWLTNTCNRTHENICKLPETTQESNIFSFLVILVGFFARIWENAKLLKLFLERPTARHLS